MRIVRSDLPTLLVPPDLVPVIDGYQNKRSTIEVLTDYDNVKVLPESILSDVNLQSLLDSDHNGAPIRNQLVKRGYAYDDGIIDDMSYLKSEDYGVMADGVTNDLPALTNAITAMNTQQRPLKLQEGVILLGDSGTTFDPNFSLGFDGCRIFSEGNTTIRCVPITNLSSEGRVFNVGADNCTIEGIKFEFQGDNLSTAHDFIFIKSSNRVKTRVINCEFTTSGSGLLRTSVAGGAPVAIFNSYSTDNGKGYHEIRDCYFHDMNSTGITLDASMCTVSNNFFKNVGNAHARHPIYDQGGGNIYSGNVFETSEGYAIHMEIKQSGRTSDGVLIDGNIFRDVYCGVVIGVMTNGSLGIINDDKNEGDAAIAGIVISNNQFIDYGNREVLASINLKSTWDTINNVDKTTVCSMSGNVFQGAYANIISGDQFRPSIIGNSFVAGQSKRSFLFNRSFHGAVIQGNIFDYMDLAANTTVNISLLNGSIMANNRIRIGNVIDTTNVYFVGISTDSIFENNLVELGDNYPSQGTDNYGFFKHSNASGVVRGNTFRGATGKNIFHDYREYSRIDNNDFNNNNLNQKGTSNDVNVSLSGNINAVIN